MVNFEAFGIPTGQGKYDEKAAYGIVLAYNLFHNQVAAYLNPFDLSPAKFNVLMIIKHQGLDTGIRQVEISKRLIVTASNMTRLLDKLETDGFVRRTALEGDRRVKLIKITSQGSKLLDDAWPGYYKILTGMMSVLKPADQRRLAGLLTDVITQWSQE